MNKVHRIAEIAQEVACTLRLFEPRGQGAGNKVTNEAMRIINEKVAGEFGDQVVEVALVATSKQSVDFYFEDEGTVVEIEFSLSNPYPCLEKDAFKVMIARDAGRKINRLVFTGDPGCAKRLGAAAPKTITGWLLKQHGIAVDVIELAKQPHQKLVQVAVPVTPLDAGVSAPRA